MMTTHTKSRIVIVLLLISMIAVIIMQVFWLSNAFRINQQNERMVIQTTLKDAIDVIRVKTYFGIDSVMPADQFNILRVIGNILDDVSNRNVKGVEIRREIKTDSLVLNDYLNVDNPENALGNHVEISILGEESKLVDKKQADSVLQSYYSTRRIQSKDYIPFSGVDTAFNLPFPTTIEDIERDVNRLTLNIDTATVRIMLDSIIQSNFDELRIQNRFHITFTPSTDSITVDDDSHSDYLVFSSHIGSGYLLAIVVEPHLLQSLINMKWLFLVSLLILGMLFYAAISLINSFNREKQMSAIKNDFISNMTHEFKTPIATVSLAVELMSKFGVKNNPEKLDEYLGICASELKRVSTMIETVLRLAQEKPYILQLESTDLPEILSNFKTQTRTRMEEQQGKLVIDMPQDFPSVRVDRVHMENILYNLLDNSTKYSDQKPEIHIQLSHDNTYLKLSFKDNGIGIPKGYQDKIFDNFFRVPTGNVHNNKGFGLGLSYVKKIVGLHHGKIAVESRPDEGTTFIITIPL